MSRKPQHSPIHRILSCLDSTVDIPTRTIYLMGEVTDETLSKFLPSFQILDSSPGQIRLVLSSVGGGVDEGYAIYDTIKLAKNKVIVDGLGVVQSIAALILQAGTVRRLSPECRFMIHNGSIDLAAGVDVTALSAITREVKKNNERYQAILAQRSGLSIIKVKRYCAAETYFSSRQAVENGFADEVIQLPKKKAG